MSVCNMVDVDVCSCLQVKEEVSEQGLLGKARQLDSENLFLKVTAAGWKENQKSWGHHFNQPQANCKGRIKIH